MQQNQTADSSATVKRCSFKERWHKAGLLPRIIIAIALGIGAGYVFPGWAARCAATFNAIFGQFLGFFIPLIILGFVAPAIADIGGRAGKMLIVTALLAYIFTLCAGFMSYFTGVTLFPTMINPSAYVATVNSAGHVAPFFTIEMPALMSVVSALVDRKSVV